MKNVGAIDKTLRILAGVIGVGLVFFGPQTQWGWLGLIPLATGSIGFCPAYYLFGMNTCPLEAKKED
ncbi:MAG: DUF2892 domain-containing protein [Enterobacterales bacterium]|nr:DUF2892 domain-containing protein [Enterobacterales bacterium]